MENSRLREAAPTAVNVTVGKRSREYLVRRARKVRPSPLPGLIPIIQVADNVLYLQERDR
jgi:hypothetical protein